VIIREVRPGERTVVGELRVSAYGALGLMSEGYARELRTFGFDRDCLVLVAADVADRILGTVTLEPFGPHSELARDAEEADVRAFAVDTRGQRQGTGRALLDAVVEHAENRGVRRLRLCTQPDMHSAQRLYASTGFARTPDFDFEVRPGLELRAYVLGLPRGI
jgi:GNAT superfamily N-acetyltransferase